MYIIQSRLYKILHVSINAGLDPSFFYPAMYKGCQINPKVARFTDAFYTDRGGYATTENVGSLNIYGNIGTAPQPGCYSSQFGVHGNSICHLEISLEFFIRSFRRFSRPISYAITLSTRYGCKIFVKCFDNVKCFNNVDVLIMPTFFFFY